MRIVSMKVNHSFLLFFLITLFCACTPKNIYYSTFSTTAIANKGMGEYVLRVQGIGQTYQQAKEDAMRKAVYDIIFKNVSSSYGEHRMIHPVLSNPLKEQQHADFFGSFFSAGGDYLKFVHELRLEKDKFKPQARRGVIMNVVVNRAALAKYLADNQIF